MFSVIVFWSKETYNWYPWTSTQVTTCIIIFTNQITTNSCNICTGTFYCTRSTDIMWPVETNPRCSCRIIERAKNKLWCVWKGSERWRNKHHCNCSFVYEVNEFYPSKQLQTYYEIIKYHLQKYTYAIISIRIPLQHVKSRGKHGRRQMHTFKMQLQHTKKPKDKAGHLQNHYNKLSPI